MSMLAERKRRQKWSLNPRGNDWARDSNKFGQKLMERMGWSQGKGLGANEDGLTEHIRIAYKNDSQGVGFKESVEWSAQQDNFSTLLEQLNDSKSEITDDAAKLKSLEEKSQNSRARLHYKKFTRGKDLSQRSQKDLANIFGKKKLAPSPAIVENKDKNEEDRSYGVQTFSGGSMVDYFKNKKFNSLTSEKLENNSESEQEGSYGFGFKSFLQQNDTSEPSKEIEHEDSCTKKKKKHKNKEQTFVSYVNSENHLDSSGVTPKKSQKRKNDEITDSFTSKKQKKDSTGNRKGLKDKTKQENGEQTEDLGLINPAFDPLSRTTTVSKKQHILDTITENENETSLDNSETQTLNEVKTKKNKKKKSKPQNGEENTSSQPEVKKFQLGDCQGGLDNPNFNLDTSTKSENENFQETPSKKKKKKKSKQTQDDDGIENPNFILQDNLQSETTAESSNPYEVKPKKKKKKNQNSKDAYAIDNPNFNLTDDSKSNSNETPADYEVKSKNKRGLDNPGLELNDSNEPEKTQNVAEALDCDIMLNITDEPIPINSSSTSSKSKPKKVHFSRKMQNPEGVGAKNKLCGDGLGRNGLDNRGFDARATSIEESMSSLSNKLDGCQAEVENGINESKATEYHQQEEFMVGEINSVRVDGNGQHQEGIILQYKHAKFNTHMPAWVKRNDVGASWPKKSYKHLIRGDVIVAFKESNLHKIDGYGVMKSGTT